MVAMMLEKLDLKEGQKVLEVGGGSGYHAALVAYMVGEEGLVVSVERIKALVERAGQVLRNCGLERRVVMVVGDGSLGFEDKAPYDRIFITCASPQIPPPLLDQLKDGGKLLIPLGSLHLQTLVLVEKKGEKIKKKSYGGCMFVPLIGEYGFS
jgi:protein-L-isoaspartate(D-aspartate) O-methyltransferase